ncbi:MAG: LLM class flavin-dependent oxidoreductase [Myxococcota bacterium]|jgi:alkanesulfonate monooxygenase SsuD/methylene tetrahydromethanopterin reductase-like flavin-dependent oxidoreductase (luciferase family)
MQVGICLPYAEPELDRSRLIDWCRRVDAGPFSSLASGERIIGESREMTSLLAAAAVLTERVRIVPSLYVLPLHSAVWAAKAIATLDIFSGGRVSVTVGVGGREADYLAVGAPFERRHARMDEQVATLRRVWRGEPGFEGAPAVGPLPVQPGGPPILAGSMAAKPLARAARWADGVYAWSGNANRDEMKGHFDRSVAAWQKAGRETRPRQVGGFWYSLADDAATRLQEYVFEYVRGVGDDAARMIASLMDRASPDAVLEGLDAMEEAGCDEVFLVPATADIEEVERAAEIIAAR